MHAMADFRVRVRQFVLGLQAAVDRLPRLAVVVGSESARRRDGDVDPIGILWIVNDRMYRHAARARLPKMPLGAAQSGKFLPGFAAIHGLEDRRVFHAGIDRVRVAERGFEVPNSLKLPRMLRPVVPLVRAHFALIEEHVALTLWYAIRAHQIFRFGSRRAPGFAAIIRALDDLPKPAARLRRIDAIRINGRAFEVIHLPAREVQAADVPLLAFAIRCQDERALFCADQYSYFAHSFVSL